MSSETPYADPEELDDFQEEIPTFALRKGLKFLGIVQHDGEAKAEFGPLGFYNDALQPPTTLLLDFSEYQSLNVEIYEDDDRQAARDQSKRMRKYEDVFEQLDLAYRATKSGNGTDIDGDPELLDTLPSQTETPREVTDQFISDVVDNRELLEEAIKYSVAKLRNPKHPVDDRLEEALERFTEAAREASKNLQTYNLPEAIDSWVEENIGYIEEDDGFDPEDDAGEEWKNDSPEP